MIICNDALKIRAMNPSRKRDFRLSKIGFFFKASSFFFCSVASGEIGAIQFPNHFGGKRKRIVFQVATKKAFMSSIYIKIDQPSVKKKNSRFTQPL